jgi:hypothetical protein
MAFEKITAKDVKTSLFSIIKKPVLIKGRGNSAVPPSFLLAKTGTLSSITK